MTIHIFKSNPGFASITNISPVSSETDTTVIDIGHLDEIHGFNCPFNDEAMANNVIIFAKAHDNPSFNYSQSSLSGSTSAAQSTQEVSSDQEIIDVNNLKSSPSSPRLKISRLRPNDYRHDEQRFQTIIYHNLRIEPLFTCVVPNQSLWSKSDYFCATGLFFTSCFLCNLLCLCFFLNTIN